MEITPRLPGVKKPLMHSENSGGKSAGLSTGCLPEFWPHPTGRQGFGNGTGLIWDREGTMLGSGRNRDGKQWEFQLRLQKICQPSNRAIFSNDFHI